MTAQITDTILYHGSELPIHSEPLKNYLQTAELPHQLVAPHTGCWRGYFAKWAIDNKKLFLIEWKGFILNYQEVGIEYLFPGEEFIFADWFSGTIKIPQGEPLVYIHAWYGAVYEGELHLEFENGILVDKKEKWLTLKERKKIIRDKEKNDLPF